MSVPREMLIAIARAAYRAGGDQADVDDPVAVWSRLAADKRGCVDRMRAEARAVKCNCADFGEPGNDGRCERCCRRIRPRVEQ